MKKNMNKNIMRKHKINLSRIFFIFSFSSLFVSTLSFSNPYDQKAAEMLCESYFDMDVFSKVEEIGFVRKDFVHDPTPTFELPPAPVMDQCFLGTCHLHAWISLLEDQYYLQTGKRIKLSENYLSSMQWLDTAIETLYKKDKKFNIELGETTLGSRNKILKFGVIPEEIFKSSVAYKQTIPSKMIFQSLQSFILKIKIEADRLNANDRLKLLTAAENKIRKIFNEMTGNFTGNFVYKNNVYSPQSFLNHFFKFKEKKFNELRFIPTQKNNSIYSGEADFPVYLTSDLTLFQNIMIEALRAQKQIYLSFDVNPVYQSNKFGFYSIDAFFSPLRSPPLNRELRDLSSGAGLGNHGVQVVGIKLDPQTGKMIWIKLKNSYGEKVGDSGYYYMYEDYFLNYANSITFEADSSIPLNDFKTRSSNIFWLNFLNSLSKP